MKNDERFVIRSKFLLGEISGSNATIIKRGIWWKARREKRN